MRCPHCAGEILDESRFCGICGRAVVTARGHEAEERPAVIELPVSRGARWARILAVLALDVVLAGVGLALILSYARACDHARGVPAASSMGDALEGSK